MEIVRLMFKHLVKRNSPEPVELDITSIPGAIVALQDCSGINRTYLGKRLGMTHTQMVNLESRGKPINTALLLRLKDIAKEYSLHRLAAYFENEERLNRAHRRKNFRETTGN